MNEEFSIPESRDPQEFYESLENKLSEHHNFPEDYLFKFIFPNKHSKLLELYQIFDDLKYSITTRESKNGKYISVSILAFVIDANQVTELYKRASEIKEMMML